MTLSTLNLTPTDHHEAVTPLIRYVVLVLVCSAQRFVVPFARFCWEDYINRWKGDV